MRSLNLRRTLGHNAADEARDEALRISSPRAWLSDLILAVILTGGFWFGNFVPEHTAPPLERIEQSIISIASADPGAASLGLAADALLMR